MRRVKIYICGYILLVAIEYRVLYNVGTLLIPIVLQLLYYSS